MTPFSPVESLALATLCGIAVVLVGILVAVIMEK